MSFAGLVAARVLAGRNTRSICGQSSRVDSSKGYTPDNSLDEMHCEKDNVANILLSMNVVDCEIADENKSNSGLIYEGFL